MVPIEMVGYVEFPTITRQPYPVTLGPYGFFWLELQPSPNAELNQPQTEGASSVLSVSSALDWQSIFSSAGMVISERLLPDFLPRQRWFGAKSRQITTTEILDWGVLQQSVALTFIQVNYAEGEPETYLIPLKILLGDEAEALRESAPGAIVGALLSPAGTGVLADALYGEEASQALLATISRGSELRMQKGLLRGTPSSIFEELRGTAPTLPTRRSIAEQSNTSIFFGDRLIMKLFRRQQFGPNPDVEIGRFITEHTAYRNIAPFGGSIDYIRSAGYSNGESTATIAMLQALVKNEGDGWQWTLEELGRYYEFCGSSQFALSQLPRPGAPIDAKSPAMQHAKDFAGLYLGAACTLGRRTAEMHLALATPTDDPAFAAEPMDATYLEALQSELLAHGGHAFEILRGSLAGLPDEGVERAGLVLSRRRAILGKFASLKSVGAGSQRIRVHGDYHLGQVLRAKGDFVILDFEGEPARSLVERRAKQSPMKDVAGMVRSFSYAAFAGLTRYTSRRPQDFEVLEPWARLWEAAVVDEYVFSFRETVKQSALVPVEERAFRQLLDVYLLDKALYELVYELNNRPTWVRIPLAGILSLPQ
jgi:maltose alpha-D-glucosyltransferase/alpha-amylase